MINPLLVFEAELVLNCGGPGGTKGPCPSKTGKDGVPFAKIAKAKTPFAKRVKDKTTELKKKPGLLSRIGSKIGDKWAAAVEHPVVQGMSHAMIGYGIGRALSGNIQQSTSKKEP